MKNIVFKLDRKKYLTWWFNNLLNGTNKPYTVQTTIDLKGDKYGSDRSCETRVRVSTTGEDTKKKRQGFDIGRSINPLTCVGCRNKVPDDCMKCSNYCPLREKGLYSVDYFKSTMIKEYGTRGIKWNKSLIEVALDACVKFNDKLYYEVEESDFSTTPVAIRFFKLKYYDPVCVCLIRLQGKFDVVLIKDTNLKDLKVIENIAKLMKNLYEWVEKGLV